MSRKGREARIVRFFYSFLIALGSALALSTAEAQVLPTRSSEPSASGAAAAAEPGDAPSAAPDRAPPTQSPAVAPAPPTILVAPAPPITAPMRASPEVAQADEAQVEDSWWDDHPVAVNDTKWVPGEGLEFESKDKLFSLALRLRAQFLYQVERPFDKEEGEREDPTQNLTIRRARIVFGGHMWGEKTQYKVELAISPADLGMAHVSGTDNPPITNRDNYVSRSLLLDWYMQFNQVRDLNLRIGQYKVPFSRDRVVSSGDLQFVDRTLLNQEFNLDRDIGFDLRSKDLFGLGNKVRYYLGVYNGDGHSEYELRDFGLMYLGRLEFLPLGKYDDYSQSDLGRTSKPGLSIGVAYARVENSAATLGILGRRPNDGGTTDFDNVTADVNFKYRGLALESAYFWRRGERVGGDRLGTDGMSVPTEAPRDGWGAGVQAGYLLPTTELEFAVRYSAVRSAGDDTALRDANETGLVLNYFFARHSYKLQGDWIRQWGEGVRGGGDTFSDGEDRLRVQLQVAY